MLLYSNIEGVQFTQNIYSFSLQYIICYAVIPMDISFVVNVDLSVLWQSFTPFLLVFPVSPVIFVESAPEYGPAVFIKICLCHHSTIVMTFNVNNQYCIIGLTANCNLIATYDIKRILFFAGYSVAVYSDYTFGLDMRFFSALSSPYPQFARNSSSRKV